MMSKRRPRMTAAELAEKMSANRDIVARRDEQDRVYAERAALRRSEEADLLIELKGAGIEIQNISELMNTSRSYSNALPILVKHLLMPYSDVLRETIARSLAVPEAKFAWSTLVEEYRRAAMGFENGIRLGAKSGLACALAATATEPVIEELISLAKDSAHGSSRLLLLSALRASKNPLAKQALDELANDPDLEKEIASWRKP